MMEDGCQGYRTFATSVIQRFTRCQDSYCLTPTRYSGIAFTVGLSIIRRACPVPLPGITSAPSRLRYARQTVGGTALHRKLPGPASFIRRLEYE